MPATASSGSEHEADEPSTHAPTVAVSILGPLHVERDGEPVTISPPLERAVLTRLALTAGHAVTTTELIDVVWGEEPPASAKSTLQTYISHLRRALGRDRLVRTGDGYALDAVRVDVDEWRHLITHAIHPATRDDAVTTLRTALGLWRGPALTDLPRDGTALGLATTLDEERTLARERYIDALLDTGDVSTAIGVLEGLCRDHPYHERFAQQQMLALYRAGRQADALAAYRRLRDTLLDELGIDPSAESTQLETRILTQDPTLGHTPPATEISPDPTPTTSLPWNVPTPPVVTEHEETRWVGRRSELDILARLIDDAESAASPRLVVVEGEAGIGKSRLVREVVRRHAEDTTVLWGTARQHQTTPFYAVAEALDHLVRHQSEVSAGFETVLAPLLPSLSGSTDPLMMLRPADEQGLVLFDSVTRILTRTSEHGAVVLVLDDLQWGGDGTVAVLDHVISSDVPGLVVLATVRTPEPSTNTSVAATLRRLRRNADVLTVRLGGLRHDDVVELVDASGRVTALDVDALVERTAGNPFFLQAILREPAGDDSSGTAPHDAVALLGERLDHLRADEQTLLAASVVGPTFDLGAVADLQRMSIEKVLDVVERAIEVGLVLEDTGRDTFRFAHGLVIDALEQRSTATRRRLLLDRLDELRAATEVAADSSRRLAGVALAAAASTRHRVDERASDSRALIGNLVSIDGRTGSMGARAGRSLVVSGGSERAILHLARSLFEKGQRRDAQQHLYDLIELAPQLGDRSIATEATLAWADLVGLRPGHTRWPVIDGIDDAIGRCLATTEVDDSARARLFVHRSVRTADDDTESAVALAAAARAAARRAGDRSSEIESLLALRHARLDVTTAAERVGANADRHALIDDQTPRELVGRSLAASFADAMAHRDVDQAWELVEILERSVDEPALPWAVMGRATLALWSRDQRSGSLIEQAMSAIPADRQILRDDPLSVLLTLSARGNDQLPAALPTLTQLAHQWPDSLFWHGLVADAQLQAGDPGAAARTLTHLRADGLRRAGSDGTSVAGAVLVAGPASHLGHPIIDDVAQVLRPHRGSLAVAGWAGITGEVDDALELCDA